MKLVYHNFKLIVNKKLTRYSKRDELKYPRNIPSSYNANMIIQDSKISSTRQRSNKHQISDTRYVQTVVKSMSDGAVSSGAGGGGAVGDVVDDGVMNDFIIKSLRFLGADVRCFKCT